MVFSVDASDTMPPPVEFSPPTPAAGSPKPLPWLVSVLLWLMVAGTAGMVAVTWLDIAGYVTVQSPVYKTFAGSKARLAVTSSPAGCSAYLGSERAGRIEDCVVSGLAADMARDLRAAGFARVESLRVPVSETTASFYLTGLSASELVSACAFVTGKSWGYYKCDVVCK